MLNNSNNEHQQENSNTLSSELLTISDEVKFIKTEALAILGNTDALFNLGELYEKGIGVERNEEKAIECKKMSEVLFSNDIKSLSKEGIEELFGDLKVSVDSELLLEDLLKFITTLIIFTLSFLSIRALIIVIRLLTPKFLSNTTSSSLLADINN